MTLSEFWKQLDEKALREVGKTLRAKGWVLTSFRPVFSAAPNETRSDLGRVEVTLSEAPWAGDDCPMEVVAISADELLERVEWVEKHAKARKTCCEGECPECFGNEGEP